MNTNRIACLLTLTIQLVILLAGPTLAATPNAKLENFDSTCPDLHPDWKGSGDVVVVLSISGGGKRASAFAYGALSQLQSVQVKVDDNFKTTLLREVDFISGVSGGSLPAAFYKINRDAHDPLKGFEKFLNDDTEWDLKLRVAKPWNWSSSWTTILAEYFKETLYGKTTFGDLEAWPHLVINATDLSTGLRFNFTPSQFNCIGSDLSRFPVAYAVAASAAYPVYFPPLVLENFNYPPSPGIRPERRKGHYVQLSDGGLVDNFATRVYLDMLLRQFLVGDPDGRFRPLARALVVIRIDASGNLGLEYSESPDSPGLRTRLERAFDVSSEQQIRDSQTLLDQQIVADRKSVV